jgi:hypothetical protein
VLRGLLHPAAGPLVRVRVLGPEGAIADGLGLLDTGASASGIDCTVARSTNLPNVGASSWHGVTDSGERQSSAIRVGDIRVGDHPWLWELRMIELPHLGTSLEGAPIAVLLGWDFLERCKLTTDGPGGMFSLEMPAPGRRRSRPPSR